MTPTAVMTRGVNVRYLRVLDVHTRLTATAHEAMCVRLLDLHRPHLERFGSGSVDVGRIICRGCAEHDDPEPPSWPCRTWAILAGRDTLHTVLDLLA